MAYEKQKNIIIIKWHKGGIELLNYVKFIFRDTITDKTERKELLDSLPTEIREYILDFISLNNVSINFDPAQIAKPKLNKCLGKVCFPTLAMAEMIARKHEIGRTYICDNAWHLTTRPRKRFLKNMAFKKISSGIKANNDAEMS